MSKSKKVNPRRRPATRADVEKAKKQATGEAVEIALVLAMSVLHDKWGFGVTRLKRFWEQLNSYSDSVVLGYASVPDMKTVLKDEMGIEFTGFGGHENER